MNNIIGITGHRPEKLLGYDKESTAKMVSFCKEILTEIKPDKIISGMALGTDQYFVKAAIELEIPFVAAVPFEGQESLWPEDSRKEYHELLSKAERVVIVSTGKYAAYKMHVRNKWIVDNSNFFIILYNGEKTGGTAGCFKFIENSKKPYINVWKKLECLISEKQ